ncbi:nucleotidyltransferase family protein [Undibacterium sp. SXout20W]|uniref:nucleotidyltransferase family protein n=1 Tax=Undibacterium sp. SXout20W TaxID=3413051 RepID=UPI003BF0446C
MTTLSNWTGILLAAGRGRRFDPLGHEDKLLQILPGGASVACQSAANLRAVTSQMSVVVRADNTRLLQVLHQAAYPTLRCQNADEGMAASLTAALQSTTASTGWIIALADMPFVQQQTISLVLQALQDGADIVVPVYQGKRGHPVGFSRHHLPELLTLRGDQGARRLLQQYPVCEIAVDDPGILQDIDLPGDLNAYLP